MTGDAGEISAARLGFGNGWWLSHGEHGGRNLGLSAASSAADLPPAMAQQNRALAFAAPYLSLVRDGAGIGWSPAGGNWGFALAHGTPQFDGWQKPGGERGFGAVVDYRLRAGVSLQAGALHEADGLLGARGDGVYGGVGGETLFVGVNAEWTVGGGRVVGGGGYGNGMVGGGGGYGNNGDGDDGDGNGDGNVGVVGGGGNGNGMVGGGGVGNNGDGNWQLRAAAYAGHTRAHAGGDGFLRGAEPLISSAFTLAAARESVLKRGDRFALRLAQPLRIESGAVKFRTTSRDKYRQLTHQTHALSVAPAGRTLQLDAQYNHPIAGGNLQTNIGIEHQPNHDNTRETEPFFRIGFEKTF